nr:MAG TPA: Protein of unknown function (DUF551) [Caudoviricetes sp.]
MANRVRKRLEQFKKDLTAQTIYKEGLPGSALDVVNTLLEDLAADEEENRWISVNERLPKEHDSIFAKFKGTDNWKKGMFEKTSKYVIATVMYDDGTMLTKEAHTTDGIWKIEKPILGGKVIAWRDFPEPYKEVEQNE